MSEAANPQETPKKTKSAAGKLVLWAVLGAVLVGGGAGSAWYFLQGRPAEAATAAAPKKKPQKKQLFTTLETFTVNLQDPRGERFAQIGVTLQFEDPALEIKIKDRLPAVRNDILLLISSKQIEDLLSTDGKQKLAQEIRVRSAQALGIEVPDYEPEDKAASAKPAKDKDAHGDDEVEAKPKAKKKRKKKEPENPIQQVLFSQFIVQ
ncbi:MAG: flagellar basal body rod protein [Comamonadaceae bacterium]|nr:MAG: flagellar basal body rod protein [Comamonadaceae bacterium]